MLQGNHISLSIRAGARSFDVWEDFDKRYRLW